ncbi:S1C family serine protease [Demequina sp. NBRC 110052]|uniref:S1C family serine protease n=1 Tax=Demequina sp. NBRC 110052 TaxID=1570341 RepID=UPI000A05D394|nr:trypsin-like peptidase domain-containing protein [Demequina sp. NBRC 110052]
MTDTPHTPDSGVPADGEAQAPFAPPSGSVPVTAGAVERREDEPAAGSAAAETDRPAPSAGHDVAHDTEPLPTASPWDAPASGVPADQATSAEPPVAHAAPPEQYASAPQAAAPQPPVGRVRTSTVAFIAAGALILGGGAGFGGAYLYSSLNDDQGGSSASLPTSSITNTSSNASSAIDVVDIAAAVTPSVVQLEVLSGGQVASTGSGFVIREDGYLLTNAHVVADSDGTVNVVMYDGSEYEGTVVGTSVEYDLAVVKIDRTGLTPLVLADSDEVVVGEGVVAVGSPLGLESTVTTGIVSALHRPVTTSDSTSTAFIDAIQTDAAINPGNSGGPLLNAQGEVIGINSAIATLSGATSGTGSIGLGFAITSNQARRTAEELIANGVATYPVIGVLLDGNYTGEGIKVADDETGVVAGGPADLAGIQPGDVITAIDGRPVTQVDELVVAIRALAPGDDVTLTLSDGDTDRDVVVTLAASDDVTFADDGSTDDDGSGSGGGRPNPPGSEDDE